ncbi:hypothetical protein, partial [Vibrio parahaemolyticus]|uniref:hypothetical protein n=1 Tax=Vibrio parahaemolyticus TaxID=670 RepID=UPI0039B58615
ARLVSVFLVINFVLYFNILACAKGLKGSVLTNSSRGIQHAWHFWYALVLVLKFHAVTSVLRASPLNWALCFYWSALHSVSYGSIVHMLLIGTNESLIKRSLTGCQVQSASHQGKLSR